MAWAHKWRGKSDWYQNLKKQGKILPQDEAPKIDGFEFYWEAWQELGTCRPVGFGSAPIPFTSIVEYSKIYEVEDFEEFLYIIRAMDNEFLRLEEASRPKQPAANTGKNNGGHAGKGNTSRN